MRSALRSAAGRRGLALRRVTLGAFALLAAACGTDAPPANEAGVLDEFLRLADDAPGRAALLVGVGDYAASGLPTLSGPANDVALVKRLLLERFGFVEREVLVLLDEDATHAGIVEAFDRVLLRRASADTTVFVYLAGHGSRVRDQSGDLLAEPDALDSTFVAFDSRAEARRGERDLADDELRSLLAALTRTTGRVVVVTDSCHSGELVRGETRQLVEDGTATLDLDWLRSIWPEGVRFSEDGAGERLDEARYLHVAASRRDQSAREVSVTIDGEPRLHGALTYHLVKELEIARRDASWEAVLDAVTARVRRAAHQSVTVGGDVGRRVFDDGSVSTPGYGARATVNREQLEVRAGFLLGLRDESTLEVWDARGQVLLGHARVERVLPDSSVARWIEPGADDSSLAFRVRPRDRGSAEPPLRVLGEGADALAELPLVQLVDADEPFDYRVAGTGAAARLETREGISIGPVDRRSVEEEVTFEGLRDLAGASARFPVRVTLRAPTSAELDALGRNLAAASILEESARSVAVRGARERAPVRRVAMFDVQNASAEPLYVYLLSLEESRERRLIVPPGGEPHARLAPGETCTLPASIVARSSWTAARPMLDRYLALAFPAKLRRPSALESRAGSARGEEDELPGVLARLLRGDLVRGGPPASLAAEDWGVAYIDVLVVPPGE